MSVYVRHDSQFYWLYLERKGKPGIRESTTIPITVDRSFAERRYIQRMTELADLKQPTKPRSDASGWCYIYFVTDGELIKIGRAVNVLARLRAMQTCSQRQLTVLATCTAHISLERRLHIHFKNSNRGREWFAPDPPLMDFIQRIKNGQDPVAELVNRSLNGSCLEQTT